MISYNNITNNGRLGNQLFQYATLRSVGIRTNNSIGFLNTPKKSLDGGDTIFCLNVIKNKCAISQKYKYNEPYFNFDKSIFHIKDSTDIHGYFQSWKYFDDIRNVLLREFIPSENSKIESVNNFLNTINPNNESLCAIHIRRGDYVNKQDYHPLCSLEYYNKALRLENIKKMKKVIVTDDKEWCSKAFPEIPISSLETNTEDLWLMKNCDAVVMANSSFSWWGAYLGPNKTVVAPKDWFGSSAKIDSSDIYMNHWTVL